MLELIEARMEYLLYEVFEPVTADDILKAIEKAGMLPPPEESSLNHVSDDGVYELDITYNNPTLDNAGDIVSFWEKE